MDKSLHGVRRLLTFFHFEMSRVHVQEFPVWRHRPYVIVARCASGVALA